MFIKRITLGLLIKGTVDTIITVLKNYITPSQSSDRLFWQLFFSCLSMSSKLAFFKSREQKKGKTKREICKYI